MIFILTYKLLFQIILYFYYLNNPNIKYLIALSLIYEYL